MINSNLDFHTILSSAYSGSQPPVDLLVRTSGETRLSDFLLLQTRDAVLYFTAVNWPEFNINTFSDALAAWRKVRSSQERIRKEIQKEEERLKMQESNDDNEHSNQLERKEIIERNQTPTPIEPFAFYGSNHSKTESESRAPGPLHKKEYNHHDDSCSDVAESQFTRFQTFCEEEEKLCYQWQSTLNTPVNKTIITAALSSITSDKRVLEQVV